jgi:hypothetical protein
VPIISGFKVTNVQILYQQSLGTQYLKPYPLYTMPFLVYGTTRQRHITHLLTASPNINLSADQVVIQGYTPTSQGLFYVHLNYCEGVSQPIFDTSTFFRSDASFASVKFTSDAGGTVHLGTGTVTLTKNVHVDSYWLNIDPVPQGHETSETSVTSGAYFSLHDQ